MYICTYVHISVCMCVVHMYVRMYMHILCVHVCMCSAYVNTYVRMYVYIYTRLHLGKEAEMDICSLTFPTLVCIHTIITYIHTYVRVQNLNFVHLDNFSKGSPDVRTIQYICTYMHVCISTLRNYIRMYVLHTIYIIYTYNII